MIIFPIFHGHFFFGHARSMARGAGVAPRPGAGRNLGGGTTGWHHAGLLWLGSEGRELIGGENQCLNHHF